MFHQAKRVFWYLNWNSIASKMLSCLRTPQMQDCIFVQFFYESFSSALAYMENTYSEAIAMQPAVLYVPCAIFSKVQTGNIIIFSQFEEGSLPSKYHNGTESNDESDENSTLPPLIIEAKMN